MSDGYFRVNPGALRRVGDIFAETARVLDRVAQDVWSTEEQGWSLSGIGARVAGEVFGKMHCLAGQVAWYSEKMGKISIMLATMYENTDQKWWETWAADMP